MGHRATINSSALAAVIFFVAALAVIRSTVAPGNDTCTADPGDAMRAVAILK
jgi:hypothetical protein